MASELNVEWSWEFPEAPTVILNYNGLQDVVSKFTFVYKALDVDSGMTDTMTIMYRPDLTNLDPENFISFDNLTRDDIIAWIEKKWSIDQFQTAMRQTLYNKLHPQTATKPFPFQ